MCSLSTSSFEVPRFFFFLLAAILAMAFFSPGQQCKSCKCLPQLSWARQTLMHSGTCADP